MEKKWREERRDWMMEKRQENERFEGRKSKQGLVVAWCWGDKIKKDAQSQYVLYTSVNGLTSRFKWIEKVFMKKDYRLKEVRKNHGIKNNSNPYANWLKPTKNSNQQKTSESDKCLCECLK